MAGQQGAHVLHAEVAFEERLGQIAERRRDRQRNAEDQRLAERQRPEDRRSDHRGHDRDGHTSDEAFDRLVRTHRGERTATELAADEEPADVVEHRRHDGDQQEAHALIDTIHRDLQQQRGERAEQADVRHTEHGDARIRHHLGVAADTEQVPQHREHEREEQHRVASRARPANTRPRGRPPRRPGRAGSPVGSHHVARR